jgi:hypothetical protein
VLAQTKEPNKPLLYKAIEAMHSSMIFDVGLLKLVVVGGGPMDARHSDKSPF